MQVTVNGRVQEIPEGTTVGDLLDRLAVRRDVIAVEVNREIVPRSRHGATPLREGDRVEIVTFVGGG